MVEFCEHKFESVAEELRVKKNLYQIMEKDSFNWGTCMALKTPTPMLFVSLFREVSGFRFSCGVENNFVLIKGVKADILDFIDLVVEENFDFKFEIHEIEPITVFDPGCPKCNAELDIGRVIEATI